jgi:hypothetical protein
LCYTNIKIKVREYTNKINNERLIKMTGNELLKMFLNGANLKVNFTENINELDYMFDKNMVADVIDVFEEDDYIVVKVDQTKYFEDNKNLDMIKEICIDADDDNLYYFNVIGYETKELYNKYLEENPNIEKNIIINKIENIRKVILKNELQESIDLMHYLLENIDKVITKYDDNIKFFNLVVGKYLSGEIILDDLSDSINIEVISEVGDFYEICETDSKECEIKEVTKESVLNTLTEIENIFKELSCNY